MKLILIDQQTIETLKIIDLITSEYLLPNIIMILLSILSIFSIYFLIERFIILNKASKQDPEFIQKINILLSKNKDKEAIEFCKLQNTPFSRMILKGIIQKGNSEDNISSAIENQGKLEISILERNLNYLATISGSAPMLGFLGTVIGMIIAFFYMSKSGGNIEIAELSKGIYTAMVTTVTGLIIGIISYISYNLLVSKIGKIIFNMEKDTMKFMENLRKVSK